MGMTMRYEVRNAKLRAIYEQVPTFECVEGCGGECCGELITHIEIEWNQIVRYLRRRGRPAPKREMCLNQEKMGTVVLRSLLGLKVERFEIDCSFLKDGRCSVYPVRPLVCRVFGLGQKGYLLCPKRGPPKGGITEKRITELMWELAELNRVFVDRRKRRKRK